MMDEKHQGFEAFAVLNKYLQRIGMVPKSPKKFSTMFTLKALLLMALFVVPPVFGILCFSYICITRLAYYDLISVIYALNFIGVLETCFILFAIRGQRTVNFILNLVSTKHGEPKNFKKVLNLIDKLTAILYWTTVIEGLALAIVNYYNNAYCEAKISLKDSRFVCGLLVPFWFPIEIPMAKQVLFMLSLIFLYFLVNQTSANILCYGTIQLVLQKMEHLKSLLKEITFDQMNTVTQRKKIIFCIDYYSEVENLVKELNSTIGFVFSPQQNVLVITTIGVLEYETVTEKSLLAAAQLVCWLLIEFVACYSGQLLENESHDLADLLYDLDWYEMDHSLRRTFILFHSQVHRTLQFKIRPVIDMNMQYFHKVVKGSYSFLMFLKND